MLNYSNGSRIISKLFKGAGLKYDCGIFLLLLTFFVLISEPLILAALCFLLSLITSYSKNFSIKTLIFVTVISVFYWLYLSYSYTLDVYYSTSYWPFIKAILIIPLLAAVLRLVDFKIKNLGKLRSSLFLFILILIFSALKGVNTSPFVSASYLVNVYFPLIVQLALVGWISNELLHNYGNNYNSFSRSKNFEAIILFVILFSILFFILKLLFDFSLDDAFLEVGRTLGRGGSEGNNRTMLLGIRFERFPGLFADPILASYSFFLFFTYIFCFVKNKIYKYVGLLFCFVLATVTLSKAFFFLLVCFLGSFIALRLKIRPRFKFILSLIWVAIILFIVTIRALSDGVMDSSAIHVQGLVLPFLNAGSALNFLIGYDLGTGGNMGGWVTQGAESFIGLLMYNTGLLGVLSFLLFYSFILYNLAMVKSKVSYFLHAFMLSLLAASFLQENSFNLSFSILRICCFSLILYSLSRRRSNKVEKI